MLRLFSLIISWLKELVAKVSLSKKVGPEILHLIRPIKLKGVIYLFLPISDQIFIHCNSSKKFLYLLENVEQGCVRNRSATLWTTKPLQLRYSENRTKPQRVTMYHILLHNIGKKKCKTVTVFSWPTPNSILFYLFHQQTDTHLQ